LTLTDSIHVGIHTFVVCCFAVLVGAQLMSLSVLARQYAAAEGFLPRIHVLPRVIAGLTLERLLQLCLLIFVLGTGGATWSVFTWASSGFAAIENAFVLRILLLSMTAIAVAIQLAASGFLASVLRIRAGASP
jgi:hypothetical protein